MLRSNLNIKVVTVFFFIILFVGIRLYLKPVQKSARVIETPGFNLNQPDEGLGSSKPQSEMNADAKSSEAPKSNSNPNFERVVAQVKEMSPSALYQRKLAIQSEIKDLDLIERFNRHLLDRDEIKKLRALALESSVITLQQVQGFE